MRKDNRSLLELRPLNFTSRYLQNVPGSCLSEQGNTRVICSASFDLRVPYFLKDSGKGWVNAEYGMIPGSVGTPRMNRERNRPNNRNIEIQRFIGRALRCTFNLKSIEGKSIHIDADVIQADGGTRCAAVNGSMVALVDCLKKMVFENLLRDLPKIEPVAAVSLGIRGEELLVDLDYQEDSAVDADINIVSNSRGEVIEMLVFAEESRIPAALLQQAISTGINKNMEILEKIKSLL